MDNILALHRDLVSHAYRHGGYEHFVVTDPKRRDIHKASVRDRLVHHAIHRMLYPYFDTRFIHDSYSCRNGKGTHRAIAQFRRYAGKVSENHTRTCYVLKCDIRKFFASIDHVVLLRILERQIPDQHIIGLLKAVIGSFSSTAPGKGLPLGNLTSQLLVNIYMNEFDLFVKHKLKVKYYIRYADDFTLFWTNWVELKEQLQYIKTFLLDNLRLELHHNKVSICTVASGVDFLGWVHFPSHRNLRAASRRRMLRRIKETRGKKEPVQSYFGLLKHGNSYKLYIQIGQFKYL